MAHLFKIIFLTDLDRKIDSSQKNIFCVTIFIWKLSQRKGKAVIVFVY